MRSINLQTADGDMQLEVTNELETYIAKRNGIPDSAVTDSMIVMFFREASDVAFRKATSEYIEDNGKNT